MKIIEKCYSMVILSQTLAEPSAIGNPKTLKLTSNMVYVNEKNFHK